MRYNLGYLDKYPLETSGSWLENVPMLSATLKRPVDPLKLEAAVHKALAAYPLFKTYVAFDHEYCFKTNDAPIVILNVKEEDRPKTFGKNTNDYPWRISYYENRICFEWNHGITDGAGAKTFFEDLLRGYFNLEPVEKSKAFLIAPGIEPFYNTKEKGSNYLNEPVGYKVKDFPRKNQRNIAACHYLTGDTKEIVDVAHVCKSSPAPLLAVLFSKAIRKYINPEAKNKNVACNITINVRKTLNYETMHNCVDMRRFTYTDEHENMNIASVSSIYKNKLDNARKEQNIVKSVSDRVKVFKLYHILRFKCLVKLAVKIYGLCVRNSDCNFVLSYLGKVELPDDVLDKIEDFDFRLTPDVGECIISVVDFNGKFNIRINSDYIDNRVEDEFIKLAKSIGIHLNDEGTKTFRQSTFEEK